MSTKNFKLLSFLLLCHTTLVVSQMTDRAVNVSQHTTNLTDDVTTQDPSLHEIHDIFASNSNTTSLPHHNDSSVNVLPETLPVEGGTVSISSPVVSKDTSEKQHSDNTSVTASPKLVESSEGLSLPYSNSSDLHHQTKGRKGVDQNCAPNNSMVLDDKVSSCTGSENKDSADNATLTTVNTNLNTSISVAKIEGTSVIPEITVPHNVSLSTSVNNSTSNSSSNLNRKPGFTLDEGSKQQISPLSPESKYIIPVVATILVVPLVIALAMFLYRRGAEFWERRHYRRMDFLIDGMYND